MEATAVRRRLWGGGDCESTTSGQRRLRKEGIKWRMGFWSKGDSGMEATAVGDCGREATVKRRQLQDGSDCGAGTHCLVEVTVEQSRPQGRGDRGAESTTGRRRPQGRGTALLIDRSFLDRSG